MNTCDIGSKSELRCHEPAIAFYACGHHSGTPGVELEVCEDHAFEAFNDGHTVTRHDGLELGRDPETNDYVWTDT